MPILHPHSPQFSKARHSGRIAPLTIVLLSTIISIFVPSSIQAFDLPTSFENVQILSGLNEPDSFGFAPDGRLFISERITGRLLVAKYDGGSDNWLLNSEPFYTFDIPKNSDGEPESRRSGGLRDIAFDPDFASNGFVYAFYMKNDSLQNRVVRIKANGANPDTADAAVGEELLIELPYNDSQASGSHNGGALEFGTDGTLFITTGDGWQGRFEGDPVQSLTTFTGKVLRINADGSIPGDNPFVSETTGSYQAIYGLGLRNPYSMSINKESGKLYINEARGSNKASVYIVEAGANYGHEAGANIEIGTSVGQWADASGGGGELITGGAWYPTEPATGAALAAFPEAYHGGYFVALWGSNSSSRGQISVIASENDTTVTLFESDVGLSTNPPVKPVITRIGPDGNLYYMLTTYETSSGTIQMVRYTGQETVATPRFTPDGGQSADPIQVTVTTTTQDATIYYTLDQSEPTQASPIYAGPITLSTGTLVKAKAFKTGLNPSSTGSASFTIGDDAPNEPPIVDAGSDKSRVVGQSISLDGSGSTDPDGNDDLLQDELWVQVSGPPITILDATEEIAFFTPSTAGLYVFQLSMSDGQATASDQVNIAVYEEMGCAVDGVLALYTFREGSGAIVQDRSGRGDPLNLTISGGSTVWMDNGGLQLNGPASIASDSPATKLIEASMATNTFSVELWIKPASVDQYGPSRLFTISGSSATRNLTVGQGGINTTDTDVFDFRLRTTDPAISNNGVPSLRTDPGAATTELTHIVYTRGAQGVMAITVNGVQEVSGTTGGDLTNWDATYQLGLGDEFEGNREWLGEFHRAAYYDCALSAAEIATNFGFGSQTGAPSEPLPTPTVAPTPSPSTPSPTTPIPIQEDGMATGQLFADANRNGTKDEGEQDLGGVLVFLTDQNSGNQFTTNTEPDGTYAFADVAPGDYRITFALPPLYDSATASVSIQFTMPTEGGLMIPAAGAREKLDFSIYLPRG